MATTTISIPKLRTYLNDFDFTRLFVQGLRWNNTTAPFPAFKSQDDTYTFTPIAEQGDMVVLEVGVGKGAIPPKSEIDRVEKYITKLAHEHILIFVNRTRTTALWQWVKRGAGAAKARQHTFHKGQQADALLQKLAGIAFSLDELDDEGRATISVVTSKVAKAFDRENVTKKFYEEFKRKHDNFMAFLKGIKERSDQEWYASVMLNRLMFLYFVQSKRFLDNDPDYLRHKLEQTKGNYYRDFLTTLFFKGLAQEESERDPEVKRLLGKVPYLNGGLFLPHAIEENKDYQIEIDNQAFTLLFDFFDKWQWHLDERPLRQGNEINPDVLGYIFEKYINQKEMGAYYTQEDITGYICRNTILPFLLEKTGVAVADLLPEIEPYIYDAVKQEEYLPTETEREYKARRARYQQIIADYKAGRIAAVNDLITYNLDIENIVKDWLTRLENHVILYKFYFEALKPLTVLDPTCGSGAFLFAAMNILQPLYDIALGRMNLFTEPVNHLHFIEELEQVERHANRRYFTFKNIIIRNLYGVDIMEEAVEICKLRLFLKLVAQVENYNNIEPLPDIDFNIKAGNTLVGFATEREIEGRLFVNKATKNAVKVVNRSLTHYRRLQTRDNVPAADLRGGKQDIQKQLISIRDDLDVVMMQEYGQHDIKSFRKIYKPFHWYIEFNNVIQGNEGFDIIIGNPPYLEQKQINYSLLNYNTWDTQAIHAYCIERSLNLKQRWGYFSMIVPLSLVSTQRMTKVQKLLESENSATWYSNFSWRPGKLFDAVNRALTIFINAPSLKKLSYSTGYQKWTSDTRDNLIDIIQYQLIPSNRSSFWVPKLQYPLELSILTKMLSEKFKLENFMSKGENRIYYRSTGGLYWKVFTNFPPAFRLNGKSTSSSREKTFGLLTQDMILPVVATLSSDIFWWWYTITSNCRDLNPSDLQGFSFPRSIFADQHIKELGLKYVEDLKRNSVMAERIQRQTGRTETQSFKIQKSKPIIDEIDRALAKHYGFTEEELDFIINYDIKYRMGKEALEDE